MSLFLFVIRQIFSFHSHSNDFISFQYTAKLISFIYFVHFLFIDNTKAVEPSSDDDDDDVSQAESGGESGTEPEPEPMVQPKETTRNYVGKNAAQSKPTKMTAELAKKAFPQRTLRSKLFFVFSRISGINHGNKGEREKESKDITKLWLCQ